MDAEEINRRATLFVGEPITIDEGTISRFLDAFSGMELFPSVSQGLGLKITPQGVVQENVTSLDMKYLDDTLKVSIGPNRFDIVCTEKTQTMDEFLEKVKKIIEAISKVYSEPFTRLALCSTVLFNLETSLLNSVYEKFVNINECPIEWQIRKVLRTDIGDKNNIVAVNNVYTLSRNSVKNEVGKPVDRILLDIDINTTTENNAVALKQQETEFWIKASSTIESSIDNYKKIMLDV